MILYPRDSGVVQREIKLKETRKRLLEQRLNWKVQEIKEHPCIEKILVAIVHEDLTLGKMNLHKSNTIYYSKEIGDAEESYMRKKKERLLDLLKSNLSNSIKLFWKNQKKFLEFIDLENPERISDKANIGYTGHYSWVLSGEKNFKDKEGNLFFGKYEEYQEKFKDMNPVELKAERRKNWEIYNNLCIVMHEIAPKYDSIDEILIP